MFIFNIFLNNHDHKENMSFKKVLITPINFFFNRAACLLEIQKCSNCYLNEKKKNSNIATIT